MTQQNALSNKEREKEKELFLSKISIEHWHEQILIARNKHKAYASNQPIPASNSGKASQSPFRHGLTPEKTKFPVALGNINNSIDRGKVAKKVIGDNSHQIMLGTSSIAPKSNGKSARRSYPKSIPQMQPNTSGNMGHNKYTESACTATRRRLIAKNIPTPFFIDEIANNYVPSSDEERATASGIGLPRGVSVALSGIGRMIPPPAIALRSTPG